MNSVLFLPQGISHVAGRLPNIIEDADNELPIVFRELLLRLRSHLLEFNRQIQELEEQIDAWHKNNEDSQRLANIPGVGVLTASALVASIGDARCFKNGRKLGIASSLQWKMIRPVSFLRFYPFQKLPQGYSSQSADNARRIIGQPKT